MTTALRSALDAPIVHVGDEALVPLTRGLTAVIDADDLDLVAGFVWNAQTGRGTHYARSKLNGEPLWLHRLVMGLDRADPRVVDHIDHDGLNCRKANLRIATRTENAANRNPHRGSSSYRGVHWNAKNQRWVAKIRLGGEQVYLGSFTDEEAAARAVDAEALRHRGEFASLNFPEES